MIKIEKVSKKFEGFAIHDINLEISGGEYFVILGPSGAGKTLLLEMIAGLLKPDSGTIRGVGGSKIGLIYQDYMLFSHLNVTQNIAYGLTIKKEKKEKITSIVQSVAQQLGISHLLSRDVKTLSGGEKQRVAIARAMVLEPQIYLLDEPTAALDLSTKNRTQQLFMKLHKEAVATVIHVTHDFEEALALGDRIALLFDGKIVQVDRPERIFNNPATRAVADFLGYKNVFSGEIEGSRMTLNGIQISTPMKKAELAFIAIGSNDIILSGEKIFSSARNAFKGKIVKLIKRRNYVEVLVDIGILLHVDITYKSYEEMDLQIGNSIWATFKVSSVKVFEH